MNLQAHLEAIGARVSWAWSPCWTYLRHLCLQSWNLNMEGRVTGCFAVHSDCPPLKCIAGWHFNGCMAQACLGGLWARKHVSATALNLPWLPLSMGTSQRTALEPTDPGPFLVVGPQAAVLCLVVSDSLQPHGLKPTRLLCPWRFSRPEFWNGLCQALLQGIFPTQGSYLPLPHYRYMVYCWAIREVLFSLIC